MGKPSIRCCQNVVSSEELGGSGGEEESPGVELLEELGISTGIEVFTDGR
jgi:hypothetical protein